MHSANAPQGSLTITIEAGIVVVTGEGFWEDDSLKAHFARLQEIVAEKRRVAGSVCGLIDLQRSAVQRPSLVEDIRANAHKTWRPADSVAILVSTPLLRMQMNRVAGDSNFRLFSDRGEALSWLRGRAVARAPSGG